MPIPARDSAAKVPKPGPTSQRHNQVIASSGPPCAFLRYINVRRLISRYSKPEERLLHWRAR